MVWVILVVLLHLDVFVFRFVAFAFCFTVNLLWKASFDWFVVVFPF